MRDAFRAKGHDAWSCDLLPTEKPGPHFQTNILELIRQTHWWDLMIAHPPCTYLSAAQMHYYKNNPSRQRARDEALKFVLELMSAPIDKIAIENPVGYLSTGWRKPDQVCYMNHFGHADARKPTCLWLKNLPKLTDTEILPLRRSNQKRTSEWYEKTKGRKRSITFTGFADAMAEQWSS